ncbi:MAG: ABC transporter substrate-binding protein [Propioniciclava sp.]|uniref:ABC transporter substrate-binding protein n=1 Tax=Propioniciclava sp. TaxID=2038686 RepID=UPI0039E3A46F
MRQRMSRVFGAIVALVALVSFAACSAAPSATAPGQVVGQKVENLMVGTFSQPSTNSIVSQDGALGKFNYNSITYANLFYPDQNFQIKPYFLKSFTVSPDARQLDMTFPTTAVWHDGKPVTAEDLVFTFEYRRDVMKSKALAHLTEIKVNGPDSISLIFSEPDAYYFVRVSTLTVFVMPKHIWQNVTDYSGYTGEDRVIGCGPYKLVGEDKDAGVLKFEAVPQNNYLGDLTVDAITMKSYSTQDAVLMALANGEIDVMYDYATPVPNTMLEIVKGNDKVDLGQSDYIGMNQVTFGMARGANQVKEFREATVRALNWSLLAQVINGEYGQIPSRGVIAPPAIGFDDSIPKMTQDVDEAKKMLDAAGFADVDGDGLREMPDGSKLRYKVTSQYAQKKQMVLNRIGDVIASSLRDVGVDAYLDQESLASDEANMAMIKANDYDMFIGYTTTGVATYQTPIWYFLNRSLVGSGARAWGDSYQNDDLDAAYLKLMKAVNDDQYAAAVRELQQQMDKQMIGFAAGWEQSFFPYRTDRLQGFKNYPSIGAIHAETFYQITKK